MAVRCSPAEYRLEFFTGSAEVWVWSFTSLDDCEWPMGGVFVLIARGASGDVLHQVDAEFE